MMIRMTKLALFLYGIVLSLIGSDLFGTIDPPPDDLKLPPWVSFTELEQRLENIVLQISHSRGNFSEFQHFQRGEIPVGIGYITERIRTKHLNTVQQLSEALNADANYAIDAAIAFVGSKGAISKKTQALFSKWKYANFRIYRSLIRLFPHIDRRRIALLLQSRMGELYYLAKALGSYDEDNKEKHVKDVMIHTGVSLEYAYEIDTLIEREIMRTLPPQPCPIINH